MTQSVEEKMTANSDMSEEGSKNATFRAMYFGVIYLIHAQNVSKN